MQEKPGLRKLLAQARCGDAEALTQVICQFYPAIRKYGHRMGYAGACSDLILWMLHTVRHYQF